MSIVIALSSLNNILNLSLLGFTNGEPHIVIDLLIFILLFVQCVEFFFSLSHTHTYTCTHSHTCLHTGTEWPSDVWGIFPVNLCAIWANSSNTFLNLYIGLKTNIKAVDQWPGLHWAGLITLLNTNSFWFGPAFIMLLAKKSVQEFVF